MISRLKAFHARVRSDEEQYYERYEKAAAYPLFALSLIFLFAFGIIVSGSANAADLTFAHIAIPVTWLAFAIDYIIGLTLSRNRWSFIKTHVIQGLALLFPPLRLLLLGHIMTVLRKTPLRRGDRARAYLLYITTLTLIVSALLVVYFERDAPGSNIHSFGTALWWGGETVSTVGYGDYYPVTLGGRLVASALFVNGVALLSVITAGLAQKFTNVGGKDTAKHQNSRPDGSDGDVPTPDTPPSGSA